MAKKYISFLLKLNNKTQFLLLKKDKTENVTISTLKSTRQYKVRKKKLLIVFSLEGNVQYN